MYHFFASKKSSNVSIFYVGVAAKRRRHFAGVVRWGGTFLSYKTSGNRCVIENRFWRIKMFNLTEKMKELIGEFLKKTAFTDKKPVPANVIMKCMGCTSCSGMCAGGCYSGRR